MNKIKSISYKNIDSILFLRGVYKKDCKRIEDIFQDRLITDNQQKQIIYEKLPVNFIDLDSWVKSTNLHCWRCHRQIKYKPWFEPQSIEPIADISTGLINPKKPNTDNESNDKKLYKRNVYITTKGAFCSHNCVAAYILLYTKDIAERLNKMAMLKYLYEIFTGKNILDIQPSPEPTEMIQYGGELTQIEYQDKIDSLDSLHIKEIEDNNFINSYENYVKNLG